MPAMGIVGVVSGRSKVGRRWRGSGREPSLPGYGIPTYLRGRGDAEAIR